MSYTSSYERINWQNKPSVATPINATNLNKMDAAIKALDEAMGDVSKSSRLFSMSVQSVASNKITAYMGDTSIGEAGDLIMLNTLDKSGTTSSSWSLYLTEPTPGGTTKTLALKNADGSAAYTEAVDAGAIMFVIVTGTNTANVVGVINAANIDFPLSIDKGGTGNTAGYIRTGQAENTTIGTCATAEGFNNTVSGDYSHSEGRSNIVNSNYSHAEGKNNVASGDYSHAGGLYTVTAYDAQTAIGKYNDNKSDSLFEVGNGTGIVRSDRSNALEVKSNGDVIAGNDVINADGYSLRAAENAISNPKTATGNPVIVEDALESNATGLVAQIVPIQSGSGDPSPENVRPISGRTEVNLGRSGKNLLPMTVAGIKAANTAGTWNGNVYTNNNVTYTVLTDSDDNVTGIKINGTASATMDFILFSDDSFPFNINESYTLNGCISGGGNSTYKLDVYYIKNNTPATFSNDYGNGATSSYAVLDGATTVRVRLVIYNGVNISNQIFYPMIRDASETDPTFAPYKGSVTLTIALGTTVYGGTLDVKTGVLTLTYAIDTYDGSNDEEWVLWQSGGHSFRSYTSSHHVQPPNNQTIVTTSKCNELALDTPTKTYDSVTDYTISTDMNTTRISIVVDSTVNTVALLRAWLAEHPVQFVYELATPTTIQLTANDLALLMGYNRVTSDSGELTLTYKANAVQDLQTEKADNADMVDFIENGNKASRAYSANQFMLWKGDLYKVTTSIASGATITAGTNVTKTTIGAVLTALLNA